MYRRFTCFIVLAALLTGAPPATSASDDEALFVVMAPEGFDGPIRRSLESGGQVLAYVKDRPVGQVRTLLQVSTYDVGERLRGLPESGREAATARYLRQFLKGIARSREAYAQTSPEATTLDGLPAAKATWSGRARGIDVHGVMYVVIVGTTILQFHTQDAVSAPASDMRDAVQAIEHVRLDRGDRK